MKRKSCLTLALILVMVQLISVFAVLPATAATPVKTYDVKKSNVAPTVDGTVDAIWGSVEPTANFAFKKAQNKYVESTSLVATAKLLYVDNGDLIDVYVLIQTRNTETWSAVNRATIVINNIAIHINWSSGATSHNFSVAGDERTYNYTGARKQATSGGADYEYRFQLTAEEAQSIDFDMYVLDGGGNRGVYDGNDQGCYSWGDTHAWNATVSTKGTLTFKIASVYRSALAPKVDGTVDAIWESVEPTANFAFKKAQNKYVESTSLVATAKLLYVDNGDLIDVYVLIQTRNTETWSAVNRATIVINNIAIHINWSSGATSHNFSVAGDERTYNYTGARKQATSGGADYEYRFQLTAEEAQSIDFDMYVLDGGGNRGVYDGNDQGCYSWVDTHAWNATVSLKGALCFEDETKDVISIITYNEASILVNTDVRNESGIRFITKVDADRLKALEADGANVTTGTLILPTKSLEAVNGVFTFEALEDMTEGTHYYNLVNENNEWVEGEVAGTWYGTLYNIRDFGRSFSAVGYVTVTYNGTTTTLYGTQVDRTIADVAAALLETDWGTVEQQAVLEYLKAGIRE